MDREHFKALRKKYFFIGGAVWLIIAIIDVQASMKTGWFGIEYSTSSMPLLWWLPFVAGHYLAKAKARSDYKALGRAALEEERRVAEEQEAAAIRAARQTTLTQYRTLILDNLHSADTFLNIYSDPTYQDQKTMSKQKCAAELHTIITTVPFNDLLEVINGNEEIQITVRHLDTRLKDLSIEDASIAILRRALPKSEAFSPVH